MKKNDPLNALLGIGTIAPWPIFFWFILSPDSVPDDLCCVAPFLLAVSVVCLGVWIARRVKQNN